MRSSPRRGVWIEAFALALLATVPLVPYALNIARQAIPRFSLLGDFAALEVATRFVGDGTILGPYSRFRFSHPGPLYFYVLAPFYRLTGGDSSALYWGAIGINFLSGAALVMATRIFATRAHAFVAVGVLLAWFCAFGNVSFNPWNPAVITLALTTYLALAAFVAEGKAGAAWCAVLFGAFVAQTHVGAAPTVAGVGLLALVLLFLETRRIGMASHAKRGLAVAGALIVLTFLPPLFEQITSPRGNITRLVEFFLEHRDHARPITRVLKDWAIATSWLPDRTFSRTFFEDEPWWPEVIAWTPMAEGPIARTPSRLAALHVVLLVAAWVVTRKTRDKTSARLVLVSLAAHAFSILALRSIVGEAMRYLIFWTTAACTVGWMGILGAFANAAGRALRGRPLRKYAVGAVAIATSVGLSVYTTSYQNVWLARFPTRHLEHGPLHECYRALREKLERDGLSPVIHLDGDWGMSTVLVLELAKDGVDVHVPERECWMYARRSCPPAERPLHVWVGSSVHPIPQARCLETLHQSYDVVLMTSPVDVTADVTECPPR